MSIIFFFSFLVASCFAEYAQITYYANNTQCSSGAQSYSLVQPAGSCLSIEGKYRYLECRGLEVITYTGCDSQCSSCATNVTHPLNKCIDDAFIVQCETTRPSYPSSRLVETFYNQQCNTAFSWTILPSSCFSSGVSGSMYYTCSGGQGYTVVCTDTACSAGCQSISMPDYQCSAALPIQYQCGL
eukprot:TRINITY_DN6642_c0_g1_i1.p1 TRINITY_DN6642_c0_g1~~TRINITY_DN6642_c0_g1_i1.p1  ORF type:complete len:197 (+),score=14.32 TRINITY_DN6642_c0_g1_i1:37-591(+)